MNTTLTNKRPRYTRAAIRLTLLVLLMLCTGGPSPAQVRSGQSAISELLRDAAVQSARQIRSGKVVITAQPSVPAPHVLQVFTEELQRSGIQVFAAGDSADRLDITVREMRSSAVSLANSSYLRLVTVHLGVLLQHRSSREPSWSKSFSLSTTDTLATEPEELDFMQAESNSIWDSVLIPAAVSAATIIVAVLLFTVRGS
jgi:hypothetical protein